VEIIQVPAGSQISALSNDSSGGTLNVTELSQADARQSSQENANITGSKTVTTPKADMTRPPHLTNRFFFE
jgi:hypothetical protein